MLIDPQIRPLRNEPVDGHREPIAAHKVVALEADEFIRRFLLHTLPDGFHRAAGLDLCRRLLAGSQQNDLEPDAESTDVAAERLAVAHRCPRCGDQ
ncbi:transposase [Mesorhizobium sp. M1216]|uniref:transposase n=1 Tax=Mesorhizobium sp. M1216 TaxID=2957069 RepID=UPI0033399E66